MIRDAVDDFTTIRLTGHSVQTHVLMARTESTTGYLGIQRGWGVLLVVKVSVNRFKAAFRAGARETEMNLNHFFDVKSHDAIDIGLHVFNTESKR